MEENKKEIAPMQQEEFEAYLKEKIEEYKKGSFLRNYIIAAQTFKSVNRAIKRGHISIQGYIAPKRPFNNRANTCKRKGAHSRFMNEYKKNLYERVRQVEN
jgi:hypothetical protein